MQPEKRGALRSPAFLNLPSGDGSPQPMYRFRHAFLMKLRRLEAEQGEVEIEQASQSECGNHRTDSDTPALKPAEQDDKKFDRRTAQADRTAGFARQRHHQGVPGAGTQRGTHVEPGADSQQFQTAKQHENP